MDPVSVIGLVASVVQLATFGAQLVKRGHEIYTSPHGQTATNEGLQSWTVQLESLCKIQQDRVSAAPSRSSLGPLEQKVVDATIQCQDAAKKLLTALTKLADQRAKSKTFSALKLGVKSIFKNGSTEQLAKNLQNCQQLLDSTVLIRLDERIAAIDANQVESLRKLDLLEIKQNAAENQVDMRLVSFFQKVDFAADRVILELKSTILKSQEDAESLKRRQAFRQRVLDSLAFDGMKSREERVESAHHGTFDWLLKPKTSRQALLEQPWDCFVSWLQSKNEPSYWISGKAGSGKSTLMKYLFYTCKDEVTVHLRRLVPSAPACKPIVLYYLFWTVGSNTQSLRECLRSLLRQLLRHYPDATEILFDSPENPDLIWDEERAFHCLNKALCHVCRSGHPVCIFVDGLDECQVKDQPGLLHRLSLLQSIDTLKVCASSRPENSFEHYFGAKPHLRLQDLTWNDMSKFVGGKLAESLPTPFDTKQYEYEVTDLVKNVSRKAEGVFLWAALVLQEVHEKFQNGADLTDIKYLVDAKSSSLDLLYEEMLAKLGRTEAQEALLMFQLQLRRSEYPDVFEGTEHGRDDKLYKSWSMWDYMMFRIAPDELEQLRTAHSTSCNHASNLAVILSRASASPNQADEIVQLEALFERLEKRINHLLCGLILAANHDICKLNRCPRAVRNGNRLDVWKSAFSRRFTEIRKHYLHCAKTEWIHRSAVDFISEKIEAAEGSLRHHMKVVGAQQKAWRNDLFIGHVCLELVANSTLPDFRRWGELRSFREFEMARILRTFIKHMNAPANSFDDGFIGNQLMLTRSTVARICLAKQDVPNHVRQVSRAQSGNRAFSSVQQTLDPLIPFDFEISLLHAVALIGREKRSVGPTMLWLDSHLTYHKNHDRQRFRNLALGAFLHQLNWSLLAVNREVNGLEDFTSHLRKILSLPFVNVNASSGYESYNMTAYKALVMPLDSLDIHYDSNEARRADRMSRQRRLLSTWRWGPEIENNTQWSRTLAELFYIVMTTFPSGGRVIRYDGSSSSSHCRKEVALNAQNILTAMKQSGADSTAKSMLTLRLANYTIYLTLPCDFILASIQITGQPENCPDISLEDFRNHFKIHHLRVNCPKCTEVADANTIPLDLEIQASNSIYILLSRIVQENLFSKEQFLEEIATLRQVLDAMPQPIPKESCYCTFTTYTASSLTQLKLKSKHLFLPEQELDMTKNLGQFLPLSIMALSKPWQPRRRKSIDNVSAHFTLPHHAIAWADQKFENFWAHCGRRSFPLDDSVLAYPNHLKQILHDILHYLQIMDKDKSQDVTRAVLWDVRNHSVMDFSTMDFIPTLAMWKIYLACCAHGSDYSQFDFENQLSWWHSNRNSSYQPPDWRIMKRPHEHFQDFIASHARSQLQDREIQPSHWS